MEAKKLKDFNQITEKIIGLAIEVHRNLGPGLLESIYESALCYEFEVNNLAYKRQCLIPIIYKGHRLGEHRLDLLVEDEVIVEFKAVDRMDPVFEAQLLSYLKIMDKHLGLLINFNTPLLKNGIRRLIL